MKLLDNKYRNRFHPVVVCLGVSLLAVSGCTSMMNTPSIAKVLPWVDEEPEYIVPTRISCNWEETQIYQQGKPPVRGFGGRLFFWSKDRDSYIEVEGTVTVYVFDDEMTDPANQKPILKYVFTPEQLPRHYSKTETGKHSYSFWLPWGEVGGPQRLLSLVVRFDGKQGEVVWSNSTRKILPGTQRAVATKMDRYTSLYSGLQEKQSASFPNAKSSIQQAGFRNSTNSRFDRDVLSVSGEIQDDYSNTQTETYKMDTTTIDVPPNWGRGGLHVTGSEPNSSFIDIDRNSDRSTTSENPDSMAGDRSRLLDDFKQWQQQRQPGSLPEPLRLQFGDSRIPNDTSAGMFSNTRNRFGANDEKGFHQQTKYGAFADPKQWETRAPAYSTSASRQDRFSRSRFRARDSRIGRPRLGPGRTQPTPIGWPSDLQQTQQSNLTNGANSPATNAAPSYDSWQRFPDPPVNR